jgi:hypothetical protein
LLTITSSWNTLMPTSWSWVERGGGKLYYAWDLPSGDFQWWSAIWHQCLPPPFASDDPFGHYRWFRDVHHHRGHWQCPASRLVLSSQVASPTSQLLERRCQSLG